MRSSGSPEMVDRAGLRDRLLRRDGVLGAGQRHAPEDVGGDLVTFRKGQRKDDLTKQYLEGFTATEGVLYVGKAQEKAPVPRTERRISARTGRPYPWIVDSTAMVNHYYFYCVDEDFGPFFLEICSYFPYNAKLCTNGHEYAKRQLAKRGIAY